ncbi:MULTISPECIES: CPBP family intramembrane glutamic endopeptidase [Haloferax]|uniref:CPBP family intramembrane metalloprotease n=1 Tax=Haloferax marinum TaxID=2666143 RepID=A0A6A8G6V4_9EURY|nr:MULTISPECIES: CPBP family intramembrane glutamic endopeptidase [Haloferax]KAB1197717.1 CPBP family intramembrane metalloprotease [Haloferax sp. CBA1150]MRW96771.1 CPBP family intramembrane metalloprotease [Haloferax marinum]
MATVEDAPTEPNAAAEPFEPRRVFVFLLVAFGLAGATALVVFATGGLTNSPQVAFGLPLWLVLVSTFYMFSPAVANVVTRVVTGEGWANMRLRPAFRSNGRTYLLAWLAPGFFIAIGAAVFFVLFPVYFDPDATALRGVLPAGTSFELVVVAQIVQALVLGATVNTFFAFGEEFGWRAYLLQKLLPLGPRRALLVLGVVWGAWHWPLIALGYNYGFDYPGAPWTGFLAMVWMTTMFGVFLAWVALRADSVWPPALAHGMFNAFGSLGVIFATAGAPSLLGPAAVGVVAVVPWVVVAALLVLRSPVFET